LNVYYVYFSALQALFGALAQSLAASFCKSGKNCIGLPIGDPKELLPENDSNLIGSLYQQLHALDEKVYILPNLVTVT
jgi:hypothetical protein